MTRNRKGIKVDRPPAIRTHFIYNDEGKPIGRVSNTGVLYTMKGNESRPYYFTPLGPAVNKSHRARAFYAETELDADEEE